MRRYAQFDRDGLSTGRFFLSIRVSLASEATRSGCRRRPRTLAHHAGVFIAVQGNSHAAANSTFIMWSMQPAAYLSSRLTATGDRWSPSMISSETPVPRVVFCGSRSGAARRDSVRPPSSFRHTYGESCDRATVNRPAGSPRPTGMTCDLPVIYTASGALGLQPDFSTTQAGIHSLSCLQSAQRFFLKNRGRRFGNFLQKLAAECPSSLENGGAFPPQKKTENPFFPGKKKKTKNPLEFIEQLD